MTYQKIGLGLVPWVLKAAQEAVDHRIISSTPEAPNPASVGNSLFEDSWGKPLEDTGVGQ